MISERLKAIGEYAAAGAFEEENRSLFYRKALGIRRYYENCALPVYEGKALYPSGTMRYDMIVHPDYLFGLTTYEWKWTEENKDLGEALRRDFDAYNVYKAFVQKPHTVAGCMYTHSMPNYERVLKEGLYSYIPRIQKIADADMKEGLLHLVRGIETYVNRMIVYLKDVGADERLIKGLEKVPLYPAENIYEAILAWNFVMYLDNCDNLGCVASGLAPYHKGEDVTDLLGELFDNLNANNGYSMALGTDYTPLTLQCLEASKGRRRPMIELFVDENTPEEIWEKAFEVIRTNNGQPAFYNGKVLLKGLQEKVPKITDEDLKKFCGGGCTESMLAGLSNVGSVDAGINLLYIFENTLKQSLRSAKSFDAFYETYVANVKGVIKTVTEQISRSQEARAKYQPLPMRTLLIDDCIDAGLDFNNGGARYKWSLVNFAGMINVIDGLFVVKEFVFKQKRFTAEELIKKLEAEDESFLKQARANEKCFGVDDEEVNDLTRAFSTEIFQALLREKPAIGEAFLPCSIQFMSQVGAGKIVGATPDGRKNGAPLCDSLAAIFGKDVKGPTALLKSVTALDLKDAVGVPVLNFNVQPSFKNETLKSLILAYMQLGGVQMQLTCMSADTLVKAYENPEEYKNLVVRVGGYSEYFYRLSDELKKMVMERSIQTQV